jgi:hypothetical protein
MIEWEVTETGLRVFGAGAAEVHLRSPDLSVDGEGASLPRSTETALTVAASELTLPTDDVRVTDPAGTTTPFDPDGDPLRLPDGDAVVDVDADVRLALGVDGPATLSSPAGAGATVLTLPTRTALTVGVRGPDARPEATITTPATPEGLATTFSHLHAAHATTGPERTLPEHRGHPPLVETGSELSVPASVAAATPDSGVELAVPPALDQLFVLAPLAYHLQAEVTVEERLGPVVRAPETGVEHELEAMPHLERAAARFLRKTFFLDCLVRTAGTPEANLAEASLLDALGLDADRLYDATPAERLATYVDVPYAALENRLPDWHLSAYVNPEPQHVPTLPFLLDDMALVYLPRTSELEGSELVERSLDDFYRSGAGQVASVDIVKPELRTGRIHGWLADGIPIDVFKSTPTAYGNRLDHADGDGGDLEVAVVLNDEEMYDESDDVADIYRSRAEDLPMELGVERNLSTERLARVFESDADFVHYIGHCETDGLRCPDGYLSTASLDRVGTEVFFLNACGSFHEGMELVERGAVAGAITFSQVLNDHAVKVGSTFARLLVNGFGIERAMRLARRRIMMGKDYAVVGDGTHRLTGGDGHEPASAVLQELDDGGFLLTYDQFSAAQAGGTYRPDVESDGYAYLCGNESEFALDRDAVVEFLGRTAMPVVYDGDVYWSAELRATLAER